MVERQAWLSGVQLTKQLSGGGRKQKTRSHKRFPIPLAMKIGLHLDLSYREDKVRILLCKTLQILGLFKDKVTNPILSEAVEQITGCVPPSVTDFIHIHALSSV